MKEMPERIYLFDCNEALTTPLEGDTEYIRKDIVDDMIKTAEDHAFFAGSEYTRKERVDKDFEWLVGNFSKYISAIKQTDVIAIDCKLFEDFRKFMEE